MELDDEPPGGAPSVHSFGEDTKRTSSIEFRLISCMTGPHQLQVSAEPPIFKPIVVGERQGERICSTLLTSRGMNINLSHRRTRI